MCPSRIFILIQYVRMITGCILTSFLIKAEFFFTDESKPLSEFPCECVAISDKVWLAYKMARMYLNVVA